KNFDDAVVSLLRSVEKKGWAVFQIYDISERLAAKGFNHSPLKIIEICSAKYANNFLNKSKLISLFMPCKINIFEENGKVKIAAMKPTAISQFFPNVDGESSAEVERDIIDIVADSL
ncbi:MAG: DUF302 domain-containing protein, partial [Nitrosopumilaceae archaeon]